MKKSISFVLLATIMLQNCVVYQKTPVHLRSAVELGRVKVVSTSGKKTKFKNIEFSDGSLVGIKGNKIVQIKEELVAQVYLKDHTTSTWVTIVFSVLGPGLLIFVIMPLISLAVNGIQV